MGQVVSIKAFTQKKKDAYLLSNGRLCPSCGSADIDDSASVEFEGNRAWHSRACSGCGEGWIDHFKLAGVGEYVPTISLSRGLAYIESGGGSCIFCGDDEIESGDFDAEEDGISQKVTCGACGKNWYDLYALVDIE